MIKPIGNRKVKTHKEKFMEKVADNKDKTWYVCSHDNPDPDSIASVFGIKSILSYLGIDNIHMVYCGEISHPQNRAMINVLDIPIIKWDAEAAEDNAVFIFVDCSYGQKNISISKKPLIVVDHHKVNTDNKDILFIHDELGACSTLVLDLTLSITKKKLSEDKEDEYSQCFDPEEENNKSLATALAIGVKTDTLDFLSETTSNNDIEAFRMLARYLSDVKYSRIINYEFPPYVMDYEQIAWANKKSEFQPNFITGLGYVGESKSDCIPTIADKFMRLQGVQTVVVYAIVGKSIKASVRTSSASFDCKTLCDDIFGKGNGGAKQGIGGAKVFFNVFNPEKMSDEGRKSLEMLVKNEIERKFDSATTK